ncbi:MAG: 50S ribosomal protein L10 [Planctomycetes bacterium]|nr:50S ribosomal protein L10 [Planctomycetota bacterium]
MSKLVNNSIIDGFDAEFGTLTSCVLVGTVGLNVAQTTALRSKLRGKNMRMRMVKNSLASVSFKRRGLEPIGGMLSGPSAIVFGGEGANEVAKVLLEAKVALKNKLVLHGGWSEGEFLNSAEVEALSKAPGRTELLSMMLGAIGGPLTGMAAQFNGLFNEMHGLIEALEKSKETEGAAA